jgi:glutamyl-tRNA(Gln) amidotransferase subunit E
MYPETDVKPVQITPERISGLRACLPDMPEVKLRRFMEEHGLNEKLATQMVDSDYLGLFEELSAEGHSTTLLAVTLTEDLTRLRRDGVPVEALSDEVIRGAFTLVKEGSTAKEALPDVLTWLAKHPGSSAGDALRALGLEAMSLSDLETLVEAVVEERADLVAERGMGAMGPLMGAVMGKVRGRAQPRDVQRLLQAALEAKTRSP